MKSESKLIHDHPDDDEEMEDPEPGAEVVRNNSMTLKLLAK